MKQFKFIFLSTRQKLSGYGTATISGDRNARVSERESCSTEPRPSRLLTRAFLSPPSKFFSCTEFIFIFFLILFSVPIFAAQQQTAALELTQLLNGFSTFQAHFTQTTTDVNHQVLQQSSGTMMLMRPDRFRWETKNPTHQIVITDGKTLWIYDVDLKQATKQSIQNSPINPAKLLSGDVSMLMKQFDVHVIPHQNASIFQLIPKKPTRQFRSVAIAFQNHQLHSMQIQNTMEQTNTFVFSNVVVNKSLLPDLFKFTAPHGVDVMQ